jgi:hypothetical protein
VVKGFWEFDNATSLGLDSTSNANNLTPVGTPTRGQGVNYYEGIASAWSTITTPTYLWAATAFAPRPLYYAGAETPRLLFDGVDDCFTGTAVSFPAAFHLLAVLAVTLPAATEPVIANNTATTAIRVKNDTTITVVIAGTPQDFTVPSLGSTVHLLEVARNADDVVTLWVDAVQVASTYVMAGAATFNRIATDGAQYYAGSLYALAGWTRTFTSLEQRQVESSMVQAYAAVFDPAVLAQFQTILSAMCSSLVRAYNAVPVRGRV